MPTTDQKSDLLFKKYLGKGSSGTSSLYFNEPFDGRSAVFPVQIWQDQSLIPLSAAPVPNVVEQVTDLVLTQVPGQPFAFYSSQLRDAIPFNYDFSGSYVPVVRKNDNSIIAFGENDWVIDIETGMLTFYAGLPSGVSEVLPPKVTFWKYIGPKGIPTGSATASWAGTASWSETASYAFTSSYTSFSELSSASYNAITSLTALSANTATTANTANTANFATSAGTASWAWQAKTASFLGSNFGGGGVANGTASHAMTSGQSKLADTASYAYFAQVTLGTASYAYVAINALDADHADYADQAGTSATASFVAQAKTAITASHAMYAEIALGTSSYAINAGSSDTASYLNMAGGTASYALMAAWAVSSSHTERAEYTYGTSSYANRAGSSSYAESSSYALYAQIALGTSSYAINAGTASWANMATIAVNAWNAYTASYVYQAKTAISASHAEQADDATTASYAHFAQVVLGTSSYAIGADWAITASYAHIASWAVSASHAERAEFTYGTASHAVTSRWAQTASYVPEAISSSYAETASYSHFAQVALGTSSYAINAGTASYVNLARTASIAMFAYTASYVNHAVSSSYASQASNAELAEASIYSLSASQATFAFSTLEASSSISSSYAETASYAFTASVAERAITASYALTASYFDGTASGSAINIGLPTDGYYGSGSQGNIAALDQGDKLEDALDKLDVILDKLVPTRPPGLNTKTFQMASSYAARKAGTNTNFTNVTDIQTPSFTMVGGETGSNAFSNGDSGTLTALIDGGSIGTRVLTSGDDTGTYGGLQIVADADYYVGQSGKQGFWNALLARINVQSAIDDDLPHTASMSHTLTGAATAAYFYVDNPQTPGPLFGDVVASGLTYVSGVPAFVGGVSGSAITFTATASFGFTWRFYNNTRVFAGSGTGITSTNCPLPNAPLAGSVLSGSWSAAVSAGSTSENAAYTITAYNSKGGTAALSLSNTHYRLDSTLDTANRVTSGVGQYPSSGYGMTFDASATLSGSGNEELQMLNGQYRYPTGNYTGSLPVAGPNYSAVPTGTYSNMRWVTLNLGSVSAASNLTLTFTNSSNFSGGGTPMTNFALYVRVNGASPTVGWVDGNVAYPGVGSPTNNGDAALVVASSTSTVKLVTFGTNTKTGTVYVRVGIPSGDNKRFTNITMTAA